MDRHIASPLFTSLLLALTIQNVRAESEWSVPFSVAVGIGTMQNSDLNLKSRKMDSISAGILPSYQIKSWSFGPHLEYRMQGQIDSLSAAGGTNLKGHGFFAGVGGRYNFKSQIYAESVLDFMGQYNFEKATSSGDSDSLRGPIAIRLKTGYVVSHRIPNLTVDFDVQFLRFNRVAISGNSQNASTNQFMAAVGLTYQISGRKDNVLPEQNSERNENSAPSHDLAINQEMSKPPLLNLSEADFVAEAAGLSSQGATRISEIVGKLRRSSLIIVGLDPQVANDPNEKSYQRLASRMDNVKLALVRQGLKDLAIRIETLGSTARMTPNRTLGSQAPTTVIEIYADPN